MLLDFTVGNYRSLRDSQTLSLVATPLQARDEEVDEKNTFSISTPSGEVRLLRSAAVYGANASGKSNVVAALRFMKTFVLNSAKDTQTDEPIDVEPFRLRESSLQRPSYFEVVFQVDRAQYRYGFEVTGTSVITEWLFRATSRKETRLFTREGTSIDVTRSFAEGRPVIELTRPNALFLSVVAQFNGLIANRVLRWFRALSVISGLSDEGYRSFTLQQCEHENRRQIILEFIKELDTGIHDIRVEKQPLLDTLPKELPSDLAAVLRKRVADLQARTLVTSHAVTDDSGAIVGYTEFSLDRNESEGTKKLFSLAGPIFDTLFSASPKVLVVDELDARFHALLTRKVVEMFSTMNTNNSQLVFTTHDVNLLDNREVRRDQVWFTRKDTDGATQLYSLAEYKGVRNDALYEKEYLKGRYGGIPVIGDVERLAVANNG